MYFCFVAVALTPKSGKMSPCVGRLDADECAGDDLNVAKEGSHANNDNLIEMILVNVAMINDNDGNDDDDTGEDNDDDDDDNTHQNEVESGPKPTIAQCGESFLP